MGYVKDQDWLEFLIQIPDEIPERYTTDVRLWLKRRFGLTGETVSNARKRCFPLREGYLSSLFNKAYKDLFGYVELVGKAGFDYYVDMYIPLLRLEFLFG